MEWSSDTGTAGDDGKTGGSKQFQKILTIALGVPAEFGNARHVTLLYPG